MKKFLTARVNTGDVPTELTIIGTSSFKQHAEKKLKEDVEKLFDEIISEKTYELNIDLSMLRDFESKKSYIESETEIIISDNQNFTTSTIVITMENNESIVYFIKEI